MSENAPETPAGASTEVPPADEAQEAPKTFDADYVDRLRKENARYRTEAKAATTELDKVRQAAMSDAEKAVAEAETRGRTAGRLDMADRLVRAEINTLAAKRNPDFDTNPALQYVDLKRFLTEDGDLDEKSIAAYVGSAVPSPEGVLPSFDGGPRKPPAKTADMNQIIRRAAGVV